MVNMLKAVLLDLDDTLIQTNTDAFLQSYFSSLGEYAVRLGMPPTFVSELRDAFLEVASRGEASASLYESTLSNFSMRLGISEDELSYVFGEYYSDCYPELAAQLAVAPAAHRLLESLVSCGLRLVIATNPAMPLTSIVQRMASAGINPDSYPFELITSMERSHFAKGTPEYYAEIMHKLDLSEAETIMVGDDYEMDISPARALGMSTFHVEPPIASATNRQASYDGTLKDLVAMLERGELDSHRIGSPKIDSQVHWLRAFPAVIASLHQSHPDEMFRWYPAEGEWSARNVISHLADYEVEQIQAPLNRIASEEDPFLRVDYDPTAYPKLCKSVPTQYALEEFVYNRQETTTWLDTLDSSVWHRPARSSVFGPTNFGEMVKFASEHDRIHLRQILEALQGGAIAH